MNKSKKTTKKEGVSRQTRPLRIEIDYNKTIQVAYSNYAAIGHSASEFFIDFCILSPPYQLKEDALLAHPVTRVIIPDDIAEGFLDALKIQIEKQKATKQNQTIDLTSEENHD